MLSGPVPATDSGKGAGEGSTSSLVLVWGLQTPPGRSRLPRPHSSFSRDPTASSVGCAGSSLRASVSEDFSGRTPAPEAPRPFLPGWRQGMKVDRPAAPGSRPSNLPSVACLGEVARMAGEPPPMCRRLLDQFMGRWVARLPGDISVPVPRSSLYWWIEQSRHGGDPRA